MNEITNMLRSVPVGIAFIALIFGGLQCFFGLKFFKFWIAVEGFIIIGLLGSGLGFVISDGEVGITLIIGLICACLGAFIAYKLYLVGVFIQSALAGFLVSFAFLYVVVKSNQIVFAIIIGLIVGIIGVMAVKHMVIISTSVTGGMAAGSAFVTIMNLDSKMGIVFGIGITVMGLIVQYKMNEEKKPTVPTQMGNGYIPNYSSPGGNINGNYNGNMNNNRNHNQNTIPNGNGFANSNPNSYVDSNINLEPMMMQNGNVGSINTSQAHNLGTALTQDLGPNTGTMAEAAVTASTIATSAYAMNQTIIPDVVKQNVEPTASNSEAVLCQKCGASNHKNSKFCMTCGNGLVCSQCGAYYKAGSKFCKECGNSLEK